MTREATGSIPVPCVRIGSSAAERGEFSTRRAGSIPAQSTCGAVVQRPEHAEFSLQDAGSNPARAPKLYAVVRADLPAGLRVAQVGHALITWVLAHGEPPDNLVVLSVPDEAALLATAERCPGRLEVFLEPDLGAKLPRWRSGPSLGGSCLRCHC